MSLRDTFRRLFATSAPATTPVPARAPTPAPTAPPGPGYAVVPRTLDPPVHPLAFLARQALIARVISGRDTPLLDQAVFLATPFVVTAAAVHGAQQAVARGQAPPAPRPGRTAPGRRP